MAGDAEEIVRHRIKASVHDLVVHREHENGVEVTFQRGLERFAGFAIHVTCLALRRSVQLRFQGWHAEYRNTFLSQ